MLLELRSAEGSKESHRLVFLEEGRGEVMSAWPEVDVEVRCPGYLHNLGAHTVTFQVNETV